MKGQLVILTTQKEGPYHTPQSPQGKHRHRSGGLVRGKLGKSAPLLSFPWASNAEQMGYGLACLNNFARLRDIAITDFLEIEN